MSVLVAVFFVVFVGVPVVAVATRLLGAREHVAFAVLHDALPWLLAAGWPALVVALLRGDWVVAVVAAALGLGHLGVFASGARRSRPPRWVQRAPRLTVTVANVYVDNVDFGRSARQLVEAASDVLVVVESTPRFRRAFEEAGGDDVYPHRVFDPNDASEYAVALYTRAEPVALAMRDIGSLRVATATVRATAAGTVQIVGAIPMAAVDDYSKWLRQVRSLARWARHEHGPLAVVGDLNTTTHRAAFGELRAAGLADAHDALGHGWRPSFKLAASGVLARIGVVARLDHALCNRRVWPIAVHDLPSAGSDHRPFVITLAVRTSPHSGRARPADESEPTRERNGADDALAS